MFESIKFFLCSHNYKHEKWDIVLNKNTNKYNSQEILKCSKCNKRKIRK